VTDWLWLGLLGALGGLLYKAWGWTVNWLREALTVRICVDDPSAYLWIAEWLALQVREKDSRNLMVREEEPPDGDEPLRSRAVFLPGEGQHVFWRGGRRLHVTHHLGGWGGDSEAPIAKVAGGGSVRSSTRWNPASFTLITFGRDTTPLKSLVLEAEATWRERRHDALPMWTARWGDWHQSSLVDGRPIESVVLEDGVAERLLIDVRQFLGSRERYSNVGVPWRRGYLLHGEPGCGKSSLAKAVATECALPLYVISLVGADDERLHSMLLRVRPRSLVLIEDIDEVVREPMGDRERVTRSGLLNALDGVAASEGRVLFVTTNHRDRLETALTRSGRVDVEIELGPATSRQAATLFARFFPSANGEAEAFGERAAGVTPATIQGHLIEYWRAGPEVALESWRTE
jgi:chaperone BCS1